MLNSIKRDARDSFLATHCFGEKASAAIQKVESKSKDIADGHLSVFLLVIVTDDADKYAADIDAFISQYKDKAEHTMVLDLHLSSHAAEYASRWELYNVLSTDFATVGDSLQSLFHFFEDGLNASQRINLDWSDFNSCLRASVQMFCGVLPIDPQHPLEDSFPTGTGKVRALVASLRLSQPDKSDAELSVYNNFMDALCKNAKPGIEIKWSIRTETGSPEMCYIAMI